MKIGPTNPARFALTLAVVAPLTFLTLVGVLSPSTFWSSLSTFASTVISVLAAFFIGVGLYDRQVRIADVKKVEQLNHALVAELSEMHRALERPMLYKLPLSNRPHMDTIPVTYVYPIMLEDAARSGFFNTTFTRQMLELARTIHIYNTRVSHTLSVLATMDSFIETADSPVVEAEGLYTRYQLDIAQRHITDLKKTIMEEADRIKGSILTNDHTVPDDIDETWSKLKWYRRWIGW